MLASTPGAPRRPRCHQLLDTSFARHLIETDALAARIEPTHTHASCAAARTPHGPRSLERLATVGLSVADLVDTPAEGTVGGTLARRTLLPPLWVAGTAVGACIGFEALDTRLSVPIPRVAAHLLAPTCEAFGSIRGPLGAILNVTRGPKGGPLADLHRTLSEAAALRRVMERHRNACVCDRAQRARSSPSASGKGGPQPRAQRLEAIGAHGGEAELASEPPRLCCHGPTLQTRSRARAYALRWPPAQRTW